MGFSATKTSVGWSPYAETWSDAASSCVVLRKMKRYRQSGYFIRKMSPYAHAVVGLCPINHVPDGFPQKVVPNHKTTEKAVQNLGVRGKYTMKRGGAQRFLLTDTSHNRLTDGNGKYWIPIPDATLFNSEKPKVCWIRGQKRLPSYSTHLRFFP